MAGIQVFYAQGLSGISGTRKPRCRTLHACEDIFTILLPDSVIPHEGPILCETSRTGQGLC